MPGFDVAIIGLGAMGSFTALELAGRGASVVGFDRWSPPHQEGSHGGETRAFRTLYTEHPDYVPLMKRSLELWERLAGECRRDLLTWTGVLSLGEPGSPLIEGVQQSASVHGLPVQALSGDEVRRRFPALSPPGNFTGLLDTRAGLIDVEAALGCALQEARRLGADLRLDREVLEWSVEGREVWVRTRRERVRARRLVVTAGAWSGAILRALKLPLVVRRQVLTWFQTPPAGMVSARGGADLRLRPRSLLWLSRDRRRRRQDRLSREGGPPAEIPRPSAPGVGSRLRLPGAGYRPICPWPIGP